MTLIQTEIYNFLQAVFHRGVLRTVDIDAEVERHYEIPYVYFGTFDGHAGAGCAIAAANELHQVSYLYGMQTFLPLSCHIQHFCR